MPPKPNSRNWNDVQTAIATVAVVTTLGLWNLFAQPSTTVSAKADEPVTPPPTEPPVTMEPTSIPQVKIMFTQVAPQTFVDVNLKTTKKGTTTMTVVAEAMSAHPRQSHKQRPHKHVASS